MEHLRERHAINPFTEEKIPIWISEYVLKDYGTGAIMAVPSDDDRDYRFATHFDLPIIEIIDRSDYPNAGREDKVGTMVNSRLLNGMEVKDAIPAIICEIEDRNIGTGRVNYKLRDAIYSRQRYWGEPFPIVYDTDGIAHAMNISDLPLELPELDDFKPASGAKSPLARVTDWVNMPDGYTRETDTMPGFAGSSWYYLRYMDVDNDTEFASQDAINYWKDVDLYIGGAEHAVGHLMYARFWHKFLYDKNLVPVKEPFRKLVNQGMIQGIIESMYLDKEKKDGYNRFLCAGLAVQEISEGKEFVQIPVHVDFVEEYGADNSYMSKQSIEQFIAWRPEFADAVFECSKGTYHKGVFTPKKGEATHLFTVSEVGKMSKRYFNVVNPDRVIERYGADCFRMYEMFLGPIDQAKPWDTNGIDGISKFLRRFWSLFYDENDNWLVIEGDAATKEELKPLHATIKKVTEYIERFSFNTCVSAFMVCVNELKSLHCHKKAVLQDLVILMAPFAPHITEELWHALGNTTSVHHATYPEYNAEYLKEDSVTYPISINGKKRALADLPSDASKEDLEVAALAMPEIQKYTEGKTVRKVIVVPGRMINVVVS